MASAYTTAELRIIRRLATPLAVQHWLHGMPYNREPAGPTYRTLRGVLSRGTAHCGEAALSAAAILEHHGYPPRLLVLDSIDGLGHVLFLYHASQGLGTVARSRDPGLHGRRPTYRNLRNLAHSYIDPYIDLTGCVNGYAEFDLRDLPRRIDWRTSSHNVFAVERALNSIPMTRVRVAPARVRRLRARYRRFLRTNPGEKPTNYRNRSTWV
jgi:hypothetical protein